MKDFILGSIMFFIITGAVLAYILGNYIIWKTNQEEEKDDERRHDKKEYDHN